MKKRHILAIDGGATKTTLILRSENGNNLFEKTVTGSNYQTIGEQHVEKLLIQLLKEVYLSTKQSEIDVAVFSLAGIDSEHDLTIVRNLVERSCKNSQLTINKVIVENDVLATLIGLTGKNPGALIISGTGSIAYAQDGNGNIVRTGGWGHRAGDEGSGFWIGKEILKTIFRIEDGRSIEQTVLKQLVYEQLRIQTVEQLMTWLYRSEYTNAQVADISSILYKAIILGDEQAIIIARRAAKELSILAIATLKKFIDPNNTINLYLNGGVFKHNPIIFNLFKQYTLQTYPDVSFILCKKNPIDYIANRALYELQ